MRTIASQIDETNTERASPSQTANVLPHRNHYFTWLSIFFLALLTTMTATALRAQSVNDAYAPVMNSIYVYDAVIQPDGKALVIGEFTTVNGVPRQGIARLNHDGTLDTTFVASTYTGTQSYIGKIALQADGKIVVGGQFATFNGTPRYNITRLNADGTSDANFFPGNGIGVSGPVAAIAIQPDGRILIGGDFTTTEYGVLRYGIARLNTDGRTDATFNIGSGTNSVASVAVILVQTDGKIVVGGRIFTFNGVATTGLFRLNADGSRDSSFPAGTGFGFDPNNGIGAPFISNAVLQKDGRIVVQGDFNSLNGVARLGFARLNPDGTLDTSFNVAGSNNCCARKLVLLKSGQILVVGSFNSFSGQQYLGIGYNDAVRLNENGSVDRSFHIARYLLQANNGALSSAAEQSDGSIILVGPFSAFGGNPHTGIVRVDQRGIEETQLPTSRYAPNAGVTAMALESSGSILMAGNFTTVGGVAQRSVARLASDFTQAAYADADNFDAGTGASGGLLNLISVLALDNSGRILVGGSFGSFNGNGQKNIARLNADGSIDTGFSQSIGQIDIVERVTAIVVQPDGKIIVGGTFLTVGGTTFPRIVRLNADGSIDASFNTGAGPNGDVYAVALQPDGKILIGGGFDMVDGVAKNHLARLNANGSVDTGFIAQGYGPLLDRVTHIVLHPDKKMIVAAANATDVRMYRFDTNGNSDRTFANNSALIFGDFTNGNVSIRSIVLQADGKFIVAGNFQRADYFAAINIARFNENGQGEQSFSADTNGAVNAMVLQPDGKVLMGGDFSTIKGESRVRVGRLSATEPALYSFASLGTNGVQWVQNGTAPALTDVHFDFSGNAVNWLSFEELGLGSPKFVNGAWRIQPWTITENLNFYVRGRAHGAMSNSGDSRISRVQNLYVKSAPTFKLTVFLNGPGTVTAAGLTCSGATCTGSYPVGTSVTITAVPNSNSRFSAFGGAGCGMAPSCTLVMSVDTSVEAVFVTSAIACGKARPDLNNDGIGDLLVRDDNGVINVYFMNGTKASSFATLLASGANWTIAHTGDFNGDCKTDLLFRNVADGSVFAFLMNGPIVLKYTPLLGPGSPWVPVQVADFNGDGKADILWRNSNDGSHVMWLMDGTSIIGGGNVIAAGPWVATHTADFNGDGKADILWRNSTDGSIAMWLMDGRTVTGGGTLLGASSNVVTHTADFNGDGTPDILLRNTVDGTVTQWLMSGSTITTNTVILGPGAWVATHLGDLNGDGKADIVWRNSGDGTIASWLMDGAIILGNSPATNATILLGPNSGYVVQEQLDLNNDGKADIVWRGSDGSVVIWLMNGFTLAGASTFIGAGTFRVVP
jgi:uncharacterized delta-60 repeat protein